MTIQFEFPIFRSSFWSALVLDQHRSWSIFAHQISRPYCELLQHLILFIPFHQKLNDTCIKQREKPFEIITSSSAVSQSASRNLEAEIISQCLHAGQILALFLVESFFAYFDTQILPRWQSIALSERDTCNPGFRNEVQFEGSANGHFIPMKPKVFPQSWTNKKKRAG